MNIQRQITQNTDLQKLSEFEEARQRFFETGKPQTLEVEIVKTVAFCDLCSNNSEASRATLIESGWFLGRNEQFCPSCND